MSEVEIRRPTNRACERCGRREVWDHDDYTWRIEVDEGERQSGDPYCIHEWDINGTFSTIVK